MKDVRVGEQALRSPDRIARPHRRERPLLLDLGIRLEPGVKPMKRPQLDAARLVPLTFLCACNSLQGQYIARATAEFGARTASAAAVLREADLASLPLPVRRYLVHAGVLGQPRPWNMRAELDAEMIEKPGATPLPATSEQNNFFDEPVRLFFMRATMSGLGVAILHDYGRGQASMRVRVAGLFYAVDLQGADLFQAETVTMLNDMAIMAPGSLAGPRLRWHEADDRSAEVTFESGGRAVRATLYFNEKDELTNFVSDDRLALGEDGVLRRFRFSTPVSDYQRYGPYRLASRGEVIWHYPEGPFTYGRFVLKRIEYNVPGFVEPE